MILGTPFTFLLFVAIAPSNTLFGLLTDFSEMEVEGVLPTCKQCSPAWPTVTWVKNSQGKLTPFEHPREAGVFEKALKERPEIFVLQLQENKKKSEGKIRICVNVASLVHRVYGSLPPQRFLTDTLSELVFSWRVVEHLERQAKPESWRFLSNRSDTPHDQPPHFKLTLRPEQQRSLAWMIQQEENDEPFFEEEVEESVLTHLGWRAEAKVQRPVVVRGGIVADQVGYGKTAITLACIDCDYEKNHESFPKPSLNPDLFNNRIPLAATLVISPAHLMKQWPSELAKFCKRDVPHVVIMTMADFNKVTIHQLQRAEIVFVSVTVLRGQNYLARVSALGASSRRLPLKAGRMFTSVYEETLEGIGKRVTQIVSGAEGVKKAAKAVKKGEDKLFEEEAKSEIVIGGTKAASYKKKGDASAEEKTKKPPPKPKQQKSLATDDVWGLNTSNVQKNWTNLKCPPLEFFHFRRLVVDEFSYLGAAYAPDRDIVVRGISADFRWALSGTPPISTFDDVRGMADLLGLHLGVSEPAPDTSKGAKSRQKQWTPVEIFHYHHTMHTNGM